MSPAPKRQEREVTIDTSEMNVLFVHSALDDYPLTPEEFRLYAHLARRAGSGAAYPSMTNMATRCRMHPDTARRCLQNLLAFKMLEAHTRPGRTTLYTLTKFSRWVSAEVVEALHDRQAKEGSLKRAARKAEAEKAKASEAKQGNPSETKGGVEAGAEDGTPLKRREGYPYETEGDHPSETKGDEGNPLKDLQDEGGEYNLEGDARATQAPVAPVVEPGSAPITTSFASLETAGGQTSPGAGVAVLPPGGGAADAAVTDTDLEFLFGDQVTEGQETGTITEVQEVPGGPAAPRGAQEGQEALPGLADDPHDPEATRALLLPALGGQKKLNSLMEETPPGLRGKTRRGWITEITPERAAELITEARREAGADNPWTYIIRALDQELGAQLKKGQQAGTGIRGWNADVSGGANFPQTKPPVEPEPEQPTDTAGVGTRWEHKHTTDRTVTVTAVDGGYVELDGGERMLRFLLHKDFKRVN